MSLVVSIFFPAGLDFDRRAGGKNQGKGVKNLGGENFLHYIFLELFWFPFPRF